MGETLIAIVIILMAVLYTFRFERKTKRLTLSVEADTALDTIRTVAKKRARQASIPLHIMPGWETTGVTPVPAGMAQVKAELKQADSSNGTETRRITKRPVTHS
jgi:hypothetical protein